MPEINLSDGEWKLMKLLWESSPRTIAQLVKALEGDTGWSKTTIFVMLKRLIAKGAVRVDVSGRVHQYYSVIECKKTRDTETESFLSRVYDGSIGMLFTALTERKSLSEGDIAELRQILDDAEKNRKE